MEIVAFGVAYGAYQQLRRDLINAEIGTMSIGAGNKIVFFIKETLRDATVALVGVLAASILNSLSLSTGISALGAIAGAFGVGAGVALGVLAGRTSVFALTGTIQTALNLLREMARSAIA